MKFFFSLHLHLHLRLHLVLHVPQYEKNLLKNSSFLLGFEALGTQLFACAGTTILVPHPKYRERAGVRDKVQCGFNFAFFAFFAVGFFWHREGGREGREVRNTVPQ